MLWWTGCRPPGPAGRAVGRGRRGGDQLRPARRDETLYESQKFYACILDEAQAIKNHTTQKYKAVCGVNSRVRFALTGTPVENRLGELWSIFSFLMPGYLPPYKSFCSRFAKALTQGKRPGGGAAAEPAHRAVHPAPDEV